VKVPFVDLYAQYLSIKDEIDTAIRTVIAESAFIRGQHVEGFERAWAKAAGARQCVSCANGTDAILIALRALGLKPNIEAAEPTTDGVIRALSTQELAGRRVAVQLYGNDPNLTLMRFLREREADITTVAPYVYGNAADDATVQALLERMAAGEVDAIAFTSKLQIERLVTQHPAPLVRRALSRTLIAAVGPIVAEAIRSHGYEVSSSPEHSWFMKPLVVALSETLQAKKDKDHSGLA